MENFTPVSAIAGGVLIGCSALLMLGMIGRITGISGILFAALDYEQFRNHAWRENMWRWYFLTGLIAGAGCYTWFVPLSFEIRDGFPLPLLILAGMLVGFGTRMGSGCTSGHGVCGIARFSKRSIVAVFIFVISAMICTYIMRHWLGVI